MNVLIITIGSRGDVQPYVALGRGLVEAGHDVTLCTSSRFESFVTENRLAFAPLNDELVALIDSAQGRGALEDMGSFVSGVKTALKLVRRVGPIQQALVEEAWLVARSVSPDVIVYSPKIAGAPHYADKLKTPAAMAVLFPQLVPTAAYPSLTFPRWKLGGWYNKLTYRLVLAIAGRLGGRYVNEWRKTHDLPRQPREKDILHRTDGRRIPVMHGISRHVVAEPPDWPEGAVSTGYWFLDRSADWKAPEGLEQFLASGETPIYIGFGSMAGRNPQKLTQIVLESLDRTGLRAVLAIGWGGLTRTNFPKEVFVLEQVPHDWLFPRVAAVIHHGGAGTTAAGLRAGRPTVICPFFGDQPFWGQRVHELGVGPAPIPQKQLTVDRLAAAMREAVMNTEIRQRAEALGAKIRRENGVSNAVAFLERMID